MGMLKNQRHELFAQALAAGKTADEAYQEAGYSENRGNSVRLKANESIRARLAELQGRIATGVVITRQWILQELVDTYKAARADKQTAAANQSLRLLGMEAADAAMFVDRKEVGAPGAFDKMNATELRDIIRQEAEELGVESPLHLGNGKPH